MVPVPLFSCKVDDSHTYLFRWYCLVWLNWHDGVDKQLSSTDWDSPMWTILNSLEFGELR